MKHKLLLLFAVLASGVNASATVGDTFTAVNEDGVSIIYKTISEDPYTCDATSNNPSHSVTISQEGLATLWLEYDATIPDGAKVYYAKEFCKSTSKVTMTKIEGSVLPRETGVIVKGTANETYTFEGTDTEGTPLEEENLLVGSAIAKTFDDADYKYHTLTYDNAGDNFGFYLENKDGTIVCTPHKAYLKLPKSTLPLTALTRVIGIDWDNDGTTEIESALCLDIEVESLFDTPL